MRTAVEIITHEAPVLLFHAVVRNFHFDASAETLFHRKQTVVVKQASEIVIVSHTLGRERGFQRHHNRACCRDFFYHTHTFLLQITTVYVR